MNLEVYKQQLADIERSFGALLRQLPGKTEVPNLLVDISQVGVGAGLRREALPACRRSEEGFLRRAADQDPADRHVSPDGRVRQRHRRAAAHRHAARHRRSNRTTRMPTTMLSFELTAKTYRYLDDAEVAAEKARPRRQEGQEAARPNRLRSANAENTGTDMFSKSHKSWLLVAGVCALASALSACSSKDDELEQFIADTKKAAGRPRRAAARGQAVRDRTRTSRRACARRSCRAAPVAPRPGLRPDSRRNREFLEQFSLDTLRMVGTLRMADRTYGLVKTKDGLVHRVLPGNYMGQADGQVTEDHAFEDQCRGNRSGRTWRLHGTPRLARAEQLKIPRQGVAANEQDHHPPVGRLDVAVARCLHRRRSGMPRPRTHRARQQARVHRRAEPVRASSCS